MEAFVLIDARDDEVDTLLRWLRSSPTVSECHRVHYGHFNLAVKIVAPTHAEIQSFVVGLRFRKGVEMVRECSEQEASSILASEEERP